MLGMDLDTWFLFFVLAPFVIGLLLGASGVLRR